ncbi:MAG: DUF5615 family PIN-like protein [Armatimonadota bacterium]
MRFLADESVERQIVDSLREAGYEVDFVAERGAGLSDEEVLEWSEREGRVLLTADKDFGELVVRQERISTGVILIRLAGVPNNQKAQFVVQTVNQYGSQIRGHLVVIRRGRIRLRKLRIQQKETH